MRKSVVGSAGPGSAYVVSDKAEAQQDTPARQKQDTEEQSLATGMSACPPSGEGWLWAAFFLALLPILLPGPGIFVGETVNSRLATVYALVHDGTWYIDRPAEASPNPFEALTVDKVQTSTGRLISSKPPVLPFMMAGEYALLHAVADWKLTDQDDLRRILRVMIVTLIKMPYAAGLLFFALLLRLFMPDRKKAAFLLLLLAFATPMPGYACQINNHTPAAAALCGVLYFGIGLYADKLKPSPWRFIAFGLLSAFVFITDIPVTIFPAAVGALLLLKYPGRTLLWASLGAAPLLLLHFSLMTFITGNPLPVQTREAMYNFRNSYWRNPIGVDGLNESRWLYLFHMNFGRFGTFLLFPVLFAALPGFVSMLSDKTKGVRLPALALATGFIAMTAFYVLKTNNYGGAAYGFRWHIGAVPVLLFFALPMTTRLNQKRYWPLIAFLLLVSCYSAWECFQAPGGASHEWTCRFLFGPVF